MGYYHTFWRNHDRETYECPRCGCGGGPFEVHHENGRSFDNSPENLVAWCRACHREAHREGEVDTTTTVEQWKREFLEELG